MNYARVLLSQSSMTLTIGPVLAMPDIAGTGPMQLDVSDTNDTRTQNIICPTELDMSDRINIKTQDMPDGDRVYTIHSLIWRPSRVADTPPLLPISRYGYRLFVADVCLCTPFHRAKNSTFCNCSY